MDIGYRIEGVYSYYLGLPRDFDEETGTE